jgi:dsDNA-binding SOS-regulon protein
MKELKEMGMIDLKMLKEENPDSDEDSPEFYCCLHQIGDSEVDHTRQAEGMHYDNMVVFDDEVGEWIKKCVERPFKAPKTEEGSNVARMMGIRQPEVLGAYLKGSTGPCPSCGKEIVYGSKCESCGFSFELER